MAKVNVRDFLDEQYDLFINGEFNQVKVEKHLR